MIRCLLARWWLEEYLEDTLEGKRAQWVQAHLRQCASCAQELAWRRSLQQALKPAPGATPSSQEMWQEFQQRLAGRPLPARPPRFVWGRLETAMLAALGVLVAVVWWWNQPLSPSKPTASRVAVPPPTEAVRLAEENAPRDRKKQPRDLMATSSQRLASAVPIHQGRRSPTRPAVASAPPVPAPSESAGQTATPAAPQVIASIAYAEVRDAQGELVSRVFWQATYDQYGQPQAVYIEVNDPSSAEVETNVPVEDRSVPDIVAGGDDTRRP